MTQLSRGEILARVTSGESLRGLNFVRGDLSGMELPRIDLAETNLRMADLSGANLSEARLSGCFLSGAILSGVNLVGANLVEASMIGAVLKAADLSRADLSGADLTGASLENAQLVGAFLVGTFLNETNLSSANLAGAYVRLAQMAGSNLTDALLEGADLSQADLSGVQLDRSYLINANLMSARLSASSLRGCDLRGADLTGADLSGCDLTGAKLRGVKFAGVRLNDAWADWVDLSAGGNEDRATLEEVFVGIVGKPSAQVLIEGHVSDEVWAVILTHLCEFQLSRPNHSDVRLKAIHQGVTTSAFFLEAEREMSIAAYLADLADILGKGSVELFEKLAIVLSDTAERKFDPVDPFAAIPSNGSAARGLKTQHINPHHLLNHAAGSHAEALQRTAFWSSEKAIVILTGDRRIWLEVVSSDLLTLRPPHGSALGLDLVRGRFVAADRKR
jgi:uncharacterized protein YjbI with pentapeptide repeats